MGRRLKRFIAAKFVFFTGLLLLFLGIAFLLGSLAGISKISILIAFFFVIIGSFCAILAIKLNKRSFYLFFAAFFMQLGFFLFLSALHIFPMNLERGWPFASIFAGLALIPAGWHRYGNFRIRYLVPGAAFIVLGSVLLIFSLDIVPFSFSQFVLNWWPILVVLAGLLLVLIALSTRNKGES
ncbi:MAG: DUF5668 domain-containing protein [Treponema sp.]|jgi:hypothetical protein|nr:DUF5668 domain-containing protein [Treponema sp.]